MSETKKQLPDPLVRVRTFPEPDKVFDFVPVPLEEALRDGLVVVDTNVLLLPYTVGQASLQQIRKTFEQLTREDRLRIPGQVAREFGDNRAEKLKTLFQQISLKRNIALKRDYYPLLEKNEKYEELLKCEQELTAKLERYRGLLAEILDTIAGWQWDDPVSLIYREFFKPNLVVDPQFEREALLADLHYRQENQIPPGYKDAANEHAGIGDFLIWKTLLHLADQEKRHLVFVTGEGKSDWWYRSENRPLYPRFELVDEYRRASGGRSFFIIGFAEMLKRFGVSEQTVAEVKKEEAASATLDERAKAIEDRLAEIEAQYGGSRGESGRAEIAVARWLEGIYGSTGFLRTSGFPDFIIPVADGYEGYEVRFSRYPHNILRRIGEVLSLYEAASSSRSQILNLTTVIVASTRDVAIAMRRLLPARYIGAPGFKILIGVIGSDGVFDPTFSMESDATKTSSGVSEI